MIKLKIPKHSNKEQKEREDEQEKKKRKEEAEKRYLQDIKKQSAERQRLHLKKKSAINWGQAKVRAMAMKKADLNPLPSQMIRRTEMVGKGEMARMEVRRRREGRKETGRKGELYFQQYKTIVQTTGLNSGNLLLRAELLRKSLAHDFQVDVDEIYSNLHCIYLHLCPGVDHRSSGQDPGPGKLRQLGGGRGGDEEVGAVGQDSEGEGAEKVEGGQYQTGGVQGCRPKQKTMESGQESWAEPGRGGEAHRERQKKELGLLEPV